jgi:hypothetical protein
LTKSGTLEGSPPPPATTPGEQSSAGIQAMGPPRRRLPIWVLGAAGALAAVAYAALVEKMRFGPPLVMLGLGGMTLALTGAALWRVIDPLARAESAGAPSGRRSRRPRELEREKQLVLKAIKEIELDFQMRKIAERDYREMIERYRARAMRLIGEIEAGDDYRVLIERELAMRIKLAPAKVAPATAPDSPSTLAPSAPPDSPPRPAVSAPPAAAVPAAARPICASCHTLNDTDAQFCKKCGAKL